MSPHWDTLSRFRANQSLLFLINAACLVGEATNTNFIVFGLTRPRMKHLCRLLSFMSFFSYNFSIKLRKKGLKRYGKQVHHYQQNEQSPLISNHWNKKRPQHMLLEIQVLAWNRHKKVVGLNQVIWSHAPILNKCLRV